MDSHYSSLQNKLLLPQFSGLNYSKRLKVCISTKKSIARQDFLCPGCWLLSVVSGLYMELSFSVFQRKHASLWASWTWFERAFEATLSSKELLCSLNGFRKKKVFQWKEAYLCDPPTRQPNSGRTIALFLLCPPAEFQSGRVNILPFCLVPRKVTKNL